jgi:putative membrane protein
MARNGTNRNGLDKHRTHLANQRTFLAYTRTALGVVVLAAFIFKFTSPIVGLPLGAVTLVISFIIFLYGIKSFKQIRETINHH